MCSSSALPRPACRRQKPSGAWGTAGRRLTLLDAEPHLPYDRPPLSKQVLSGEWTVDRAALRDREMLDSLEAELLLGEAAVGLQLATRTVITERGRDLRADAIVLATGSAPGPWLQPGRKGKSR